MEMIIRTQDAAGKSVDQVLQFHEIEDFNSSSEQLKHSNGAKSTRELVFVTGSKNKVAELNEQLKLKSIKLTVIDIDLVEIQHSDCLNIVEHKCRAALEKIDELLGPQNDENVKRYILVEDTSVHFKALKGLPGPYIKWFTEAIGPLGLHRMLEGFDDKSADAICIYALLEDKKPADKIIFFKGLAQGHITSPRGESWGWDPAFEENRTKMTFAEMGRETKAKFSHRANAITVLKKYLSTSHKSALLSVVSKVSSINIMSSTSSSNSKAVLIFMHGLGDQGASWEYTLKPMMPSYIKVICPTAPNQPVTLNFGMKCNSWFDLRSLNPNDPEDEEGIEAAKTRIHKLIEDQEKQGVPHERIMLGGFSQGGALSLYAALTYPKKLAGIVALSCWLPVNKKFPAIASEANKSIPLLQCHGDSDMVVPYRWGKASERVLQTFVDNSKYSFKAYDGLGHSSSPRELDDILDFVRKNLPK